MMREVYVQLIEAVDAIDNGVSVCSETPLYRDLTSLSCRVAELYPQPTAADGPSEASRQALIAGWEIAEAEAAEAFRQQHKETLAAVETARGGGLAPPFNYLQVPILGGQSSEIWGFRKALKIADEAFASKVISLRDNWLPALAVLRKALDEGLAGEFKEAALQLPRWTPVEASKPRDSGLRSRCCSQVSLSCCCCCCS